MPDGVQGQTIWIINADPAVGNQLSILQDLNGTDATGSNMLYTGATGSPIPLHAGQSRKFVFDSITSLWTDSHTSEIVNLLPAPWPPPDTNGVQLLSTRVKEQLLVELLPYLIERMGTNAPPGTPANPIVVP